MTSEQKIKESSFFLSKIQEFYNNEEICDYYLSAFLHATYDLVEHTFEEYRQHFKIEIPADERNKLKGFIDIASRSQNSDAFEFIKLYVTELHKVYTNPLCASLLIIRNTNTHKETLMTPFSSFTEYPDGRRDFTSRYFLAEHDLVLPYFRDGLKGYVSDKSKQMHKRAKQAGIELPFATLEELDAVYKNACSVLLHTDAKDACKTYFDSLKALVFAIRAKYPRW